MKTMRGLKEKLRKARSGGDDATLPVDEEHHATAGSQPSESLSTFKPGIQERNRLHVAIERSSATEFARSIPLPPRAQKPRSFADIAVATPKKDRDAAALSSWARSDAVWDAYKLLTQQNEYGVMPFLLLLQEWSRAHDAGALRPASTTGGSLFQQVSPSVAARTDARTEALDDMLLLALNFWAALPLRSEAEDDSSAGGKGSKKKARRAPAKLDPVDRDDHTLLHLACCSDDCSPVAIGHLIRAGGVANNEGLAMSANRSRQTPLHHFVGKCRDPNGMVEVISLLIQTGASVHARNRQEETPLHSSVYGRLGKIAVQHLLDAGADPNVRNARGDTPLHYAVAANRREVISILIAAGARIEVENKDGQNALQIALASSGGTPTPVAKLLQQIHELQVWLKGIDLEMYADRLISEEIYLDSLPAISAEQLTGLGVTMMGHQMKLLREASKLQHQPDAPNSQGPSNPSKGIPKFDIPDSNEGSSGTRHIRRNSVSGDRRASPGTGSAGEYHPSVLANSSGSSRPETKAAALLFPRSASAEDVFATVDPSQRPGSSPIDLHARALIMQLNQQESRYIDEAEKSASSEEYASDALLSLTGSGSGSNSDVRAPTNRATTPRVTRAEESPHKKWDINYSELTLLGELGKGAFGVVCKGRWRQQDCAIKVAKTLDPRQEAEFREEAELMMQLRPHVNVSTLLGITPRGQPLAIVTEYYAKGSLQDVLRTEGQSLSREIIIRLIRGSACGILHLHMEKLVHRDIAARNVLVPEDFNPKISDFGLSRFVNRSGSQASLTTSGGVGEDETSNGAYTASSTGPLRHMAPECLLRKKYSFHSDSWAFGVLLFEIITLGTLPYSPLAALQAATQVATGELRLTLPPADAEKWPQVADMMKRCFSTKSKDRPTFSAIVEEVSRWK